MSLTDGLPTEGGVYPPLDVAALTEAIHGLRLGQPLLYFPAIGSTNTHAFELAREGAAEGTLVITDDQTAGRGRIGRQWKSLPGSQLALSLILRPRFPPHFLVMASAVAVVDAVAEATRLEPGIKWPNDVQIAGRKICGILIETSDDFAVLGIGLNINGSLGDDPELAAKATTLAEACGHAVSREVVAAMLLWRLDAQNRMLQAKGKAGRRWVRDAWRSRLVTLGHRVTLRQDTLRVSGLAEDVDADGGLLLRDDEGRLQTVTWGDVDVDV